MSDRVVAVGTLGDYNFGQGAGRAGTRVMAQARGSSGRIDTMQPQIRSFRDHASPGVRHLVETAELLGVPEAEVFRLAYRYWYDRQLSETLLDELFGSYLKRRELPGWVRSFCQRVLNRADTGQLDRREFGVEGPRRGFFIDQQFASFATLAAFIVFWLLFA